MTVYQTTSKQSVRLSSEIARGGEGTIYSVRDDDSIVAKIYHANRLEQGNYLFLEAKLQAMLANPPRDKAIVWPTDLLYDGQKFVGYLMPRLKQTVNLFELYNPQQRRAKYRGTDWRYLHVVAKNLATVFWVLHDAGHVMGDVNQKNVLVEPNGIVRLVDADSFQIRGKNRYIFRCPVGVPEYTPPEMRGKNLSEVDRSVHQDAFGLGVLIFQLLMEGFHPFTGTPKNPAFSVGSPMTDYCIEQGIFPYYSKSQNQYTAPPNAPDFNSLHPKVRELFIKCFVDGHNKPESRPSAKDWFDALDTAISHLINCTRDKTHWYFPTSGSCPWCARHTAGTQPLRPQTLTHHPLTSPTIPQPYQPPVVIAPPLRRGSNKRASMWIMLLIITALGLGYTIFNTTPLEFDNILNQIFVVIADLTQNQNQTALTQPRLQTAPTQLRPQTAHTQPRPQTAPTQPQPQISQRRTTFDGTVNTARLNIRSGPSADAYVVFRVSQGDRLQVIGRNSTATWLVVDAGVVGWVNASYIDTSGNLNSLTIYRPGDPLPPSSRSMMFSCPGARGPSFKIGDRFVVPYGDGPTAVWSEPNRRPKVTEIPEGRGGVILGGPICTGAQNGNLVFWYIRSDSGFEGYMTEGYISSPVPWIAPVNRG